MISNLISNTKKLTKIELLFYIIIGFSSHSAAQLSILFNELPLYPLNGNNFTVLFNDNYLRTGDSLEVSAYYGSNYDPDTYLPKSTTPIDIRKVKDVYFFNNLHTAGTLNIKVTFGKSTNVFRYRVRPIVAEIKMSTHTLLGTIELTSKEFRVQNGIYALSTALNWCGKIKIKSFTITRIRENSKIKTIENLDSKFSSDCTSLVNTALPGDIFLFEKIKVHANGDGSTFRKDLSSIIRITE